MAGEWLRLPETVHSTDYAFAPIDAGTLQVFDLANGAQATLPPLASSNGEVYFVAVVGVGTLTVAASGSDGLGETGSLALPTGSMATFHPEADKSNWRTVILSGEDQVLRRDRNLNDVEDKPAARVALDLGILGGFRDKIVNGDFSVDQMSLPSFAGPGYVTDQWEISTWGQGATGYNASVVKRSGFAMNLGGSNVLMWSRNGGVSSARLRQKIEGAQTLNGRQITLAIRLFSAAGASQITTSVDQDFGTGGSISAPVLGTPQTNDVGTDGWNPTIIYNRLTLPATTGKVFGTNGDDTIIVNIDTPSSGAFTLGLLNVALREGDWVGDPRIFDERRPYTIELPICHRYYERRIEDVDANFCLGAIYASYQFRGLFDFGSNPKFKKPTFGCSNVSDLRVVTPNFLSIPIEAKAMPSGSSKNTMAIYATISGATIGHSGILRSGVPGGWVDFTSRL